MNSKILAISVLVAMVLTVGLVSSVDASNWGEHSIRIFAGDGSITGNESENTAIAERSQLPRNAYGSYQTPVPDVCGDHICGAGEQPPTLSKFGDYGGYTERKHIDTP